MENNLDLYIFADKSYKWIFKELEETIQDVFRYSFYFHEKTGADVNIEKKITGGEDEEIYIDKYAKENRYKIFIYINTPSKAFGFLKKYKEKKQEAGSEFLINPEKKRMYVFYAEKNKNEEINFVRAMRELSNDIKYREEHITFCSSVYDNGSDSLEVCLAHNLLKINEVFSQNWREYTDKNKIEIPSGEYYE